MRICYFSEVLQYFLIDYLNFGLLARTKYLKLSRWALRACDAHVSQFSYLHFREAAETSNQFTALVCNNFDNEILLKTVEVAKNLLVSVSQM